MLVLPIPLVTSLALLFLLLLVTLRGNRPWLFSALIAACALQGVVTSLAQHYDLTPMRFVQPVTAMIIPPLAFVAFQATAIRPLDPGRDLPHLAVPAFAAFSVAVAPATLDLTVPGTFMIYATLILYALRNGADALPLTRLETGDRPGMIWRCVAFALILSAVCDWLIALAAMVDALWLRSWIISLGSSLTLALVGVLVLSESLIGTGKKDAPNAADLADRRQDADIMERLNVLMNEEALYLDAELTLDRLSRRLRVPVKQLSAAINRGTGDNVSRYVNAFRIQCACQHLQAGDTVTNAMLSSGFNTKSNFNREFLRLNGCSPSAWLANEGKRGIES